MAKVIYKCAVNGCLGSKVIGGKRYGGICARSKMGGGCGAHGNAKCEHKIREEK